MPSVLGSWKTHSGCLRESNPITYQATSKAETLKLRRLFKAKTCKMSLMTSALNHLQGFEHK